MTVPPLALNAHLASYLTHPGHLGPLTAAITDHLADYQHYFGSGERDHLEYGPAMTQDMYRAPAARAVEDVIELLDCDPVRLPYDIRLSWLTAQQTAYAVTSPLIVGGASWMYSMSLPPEKKSRRRFLQGLLYVGLPLTFGLEFFVVPPAEFWYDDRDPARGIVHTTPWPVQKYMPSVAHEFTHHVQRANADLLQSECRALMEGHSRCVESILARRYAEEERDAAYYELFLEQGLKNLYMASRYVNQGSPGAIPQSMMDRMLAGIRLNLANAVSPHDLGYTVLQIAERIHGPQIYPRLIRRDLDFLNF